jgi:signal transduction histidine kinase
MEHSGTGHIHFTNEGASKSLTPQVETYLLRIIQELIYNAFRHSSAWHVWVRVNWEKGLLKIEVEDDGSGFAKIQEFKERLKVKHNTLKMRSIVIGGFLSYHQGANGLLARVELKLK